MTTLLTITAAAGAPVACDLTTAEDTLAERLAEYQRLFEQALLGRDSTGTTTTFRLATGPGVREWVLDLVRREAACCPFLSYEVSEEPGMIVWATSGLGPSDLAVLDELFADPELTRGSSAAIAERLGTRGGVPVIVPAEG